MLIHKSARINDFKLVHIPHATELIGSVGYVTPHNEGNTDPFDFDEPSNPVGIDTQLARANASARSTVNSAYSDARAKYEQSKFVPQNNDNDTKE